jgi:hypothetical protein
MNITPPQSELIDFIKNNHLEYYGKICELRREITEWLNYIPNTFPHYTRHTIRHSDTIISQISKLLFKDNEPLKPIVNLSGIEAYILVAAAYLHDAGMVTSDKEKGEILSSEAWNKWTTGEGGGAIRWSEIQKLRNENKISDATTRNFLADVQTRFLVAEFIRGQHHLRAATVIEVHSDQLGRIDFGDHMLRKAIAQVCVGHGLRLHELDDNERFPDLRDIREEKVNLRFLAILLRLGDLLDMSVDRACPLLLSAGSPLPPDSFPHWEQYQAITHRSTSPNGIEITAECPNQDVHRVLQDWCQWIVDEVNHAKLVIPKSQRHSEWQVPDATIEADNPTIKIKRAKDATYVPSKWILQFDQQAIFERLSDNLYSSPLEFIRELIQNALDALRCRMYSDLANEGKETPEYPTQVSEEIRNRYSVKLTVSNKEIVNQMSGETETKQILIIEDNGIGMDADIIEKYFLQVGRSYYTSEEFRRNFNFFPTSRFGIGFLSVFAASDNVTVNTFKPTSNTKNNQPVSITLTGFRNYLLREKSERQDAGTHIEIVLRKNIESGVLSERVNRWCKRVEFPVYVNDFGTETTITAERPEVFTYEQPVVTNPNAKFEMKAFPINRSGIEGELYVLAYIDEEGESWTHLDWARDVYPKSHPLASEPKLVTELVCLHGVFTYRRHDYRGQQIKSRIDYRNSKFIPTLDRSGIRNYADADDLIMPDAIKLKWEEILNEHLMTSARAKSDDAWKYKQKLIKLFPLKTFWNYAPETIKIYFNETYKIVSLNELLTFQQIKVVMRLDDRYSSDAPENMEKLLIGLESNIPLFNYLDLQHISEMHLSSIFDNSVVVEKIQWLSNDCLAITWTRNEVESRRLYVEGYELIPIELDNPDLLSLQAHKIKWGFMGDVYLLNITHPITQWVMNVRNACLEEKYGLKKWQIEQLLSKIVESSTYYLGYKINELQQYISQWKEIPNLPEDLYPPEIELTWEMFGKR